MNDILCGLVQGGMTNMCTENVLVFVQGTVDLRSDTMPTFIKLALKVVHNNCKTIAFMFDVGSCSSAVFIPIA